MSIIFIIAGWSIAIGLILATVNVLIDDIKNMFGYSQISEKFFYFICSLIAMGILLIELGMVYYIINNNLK